jgi:hypothetical protein
MIDEFANILPIFRSGSRWAIEFCKQSIGPDSVLYRTFAKRSASVFRIKLSLHGEQAGHLRKR